MHKFFSSAEGHDTDCALEHPVPELGSLYALFPTLAPQSLHVPHAVDAWLPAGPVAVVTTRSSK